MQSVLDQNEIRKANARRQFEKTMDSLHTQSEEAEGALVSLHSRLDTLQGGLEKALDNITLVAEHTSTSVAESPLQVVEVRAERAVAAGTAALVVRQAEREVAVLVRQVERAATLVVRQAETTAAVRAQHVPT